MRLLSFLLAGLLVLILALAILMLTPAGLNAGIWAAQRVLPGELAVTGASGRLAGRFAFEHIRYRDGELDLELTELSVGWRPLALTRGRLVIQRLVAEEIEITPPVTGEDRDGAPVPELPLAFRMEQLRIARLRVHVADGPVILHGLDMTLHSGDSALVLDRLQVAGEIPDHEFALAAAGRMQVGPPWQHDLRLDVEWTLSGQPNVSGRLVSSGNTDQLAFSAETRKPVPVKLQGDIEDLLRQPVWQATLQTDAADLSPWLETETPALLTARLDARGDQRTVEGNAELSLRGGMETAVDSGFRLEWTTDKRLLIQAFTVNLADPALTLDLSGDLAFDPAPAASLQGDWSLQQPLNVRGQLELAGGMEDYTLALSASTGEPFPSDWQLAGRGDLRHLQIERLAAELPQGGAHAGGRIDWEDAPTVELEGGWQEIALPIDGQELISPAGRFSLAGNLDDYSLRGEGRLHGANIPAVDWQTAISGNRERASVDSLRLALLEGEVTAAANVDWRAAPTLHADIRLNDIDPGAHWPEWPGRLDGDTRLRLQQFRGNWSVTLEDLRVHGRLRDYPLQLTGGLATDFSEYRLRTLQLMVGDSVLRADGTLSRNSQLSWEVRSPDMEQFLPGAGGRIEAGGRLAGDFEQPELVARLTATDLQTPWLALQQLAADVDVQSADNRFQADIEATGLQLEEMDIDLLQLHAGGRLDRHELRTRMEFTDRSLELAGSGRWQDGEWSLVVDAGDYRGATVGDWRLDPPLRLALSQDSMQSPEHCWRQEEARLCLAGNWQEAGAWQGKIDLKRYPLPEQIATGAAISGQLTAALDISGTGTTLEQTRGIIRLRDLTLRPAEQTGLRMSGLKADLSGDSQGFALAIDGEFAEPSPGNLSGNLETGPVDLARPAQTTLNGRIRADIRDLRPWLALYPRFTAEQAGLTMDFAIGGRIADPALDGELRLTAGDVDIPELGITLNTLELRAEGRPQAALQVSGRAASGPGTLAVDGRLAIEGGAVVMPDLRITGERFELVNRPEAWVLVSPDLRLDYAGRLLDASGNITIPEALIQPFGAPGTIPVSEDEYLVTEERDKAGPAMKTRADIRLQLGDQVRITGGGFASRLAGELRIRQQPGQPASGSGELRVVDGSYSAYGQELTVRSGTIIFTNQPIDNPAIQAEAVRSAGDVTAGIRASGTARQPVTELFSTPAMPEADILSYLIIGRPLSDASAGEGDILLQAATSMGIKGTAGLRHTIASTLGLDTLALETATTSEGEADARLVIGKYLSPKLYLSYGAGLVDAAANTVKMRYEINRFLSLEGAQGASTGVDLLYQRESGDWWD